MAMNSCTLCSSSFPSIMLILLTQYPNSTPLPHTHTDSHMHFFFFFLTQGRGWLMLKSESIQFCDGLSIPGNWPAPASSCLQPPLKPPRAQQAHLEWQGGQWRVRGAPLGVCVQLRCPGPVPRSGNLQRVVLIFPLPSGSACLSATPRGAAQPVGLAPSHTVCADSMLIYYSIIRVIGCAHG